MNEKALRALLESVRSGATDVDAAVDAVRDLPFADLGFARVDHHRALRQGQPEVILGEPKTPEQIAAIADEIAKRGTNVLITRVSPDQLLPLRTLYPQLRYSELARVATIEVAPIAARAQKVVIVTAGTGDIPVAEEASETLRMTGFTADRLFDAGVAGIHRILASRHDLLQADAVIVVAGMEGALPSVVGGMVACPVIAVPTSVGYGTHLGGLTPMFAMLSSCASGVVVVNIDNGFGAAMAVHRMFPRLTESAGK